jgi:hypothetical protein
MTRCFSHQPEALTCHPRRARPARLAAEGVSEALNSRRWPAVMTPRIGGLRADDAVASRRAADGAGPSIEAARTYAGGISRGAVAAVTCVWPANGAWVDTRIAPRAAAGVDGWARTGHVFSKVIYLQFRGSDAYP